jgi:hypothetical protein
MVQHKRHNQLQKNLHPRSRFRYELSVSLKCLNALWKEMEIEVVSVLPVDEYVQHIEAEDGR